LIKNHLFLHLVYDIRRLGVPGNTNSAIGEMCHKILCKETGRRTNMSACTFERQTSLRYVENLTVLRAYCDHPEWTHGPEKDDIVCPQNTYQCALMTVGFNYVRVKNGGGEWAMFLIKTGAKETQHTSVLQRLKYEEIHFLQNSTVGCAGF
jgi:hypothetical protein